MTKRIDIIRRLIDAFDKEDAFAKQCNVRVKSMILCDDKISLVIKRTVEGDIMFVMDKKILCKNIGSPEKVEQFFKGKKAHIIRLLERRKSPTAIKGRVGL